MTKVLLINPRFGAYNVDPDADLESLPVGLMYIGSFLTSKGFTVKLVNCLAIKDYLEVISRELDSTLCVGISVMTPQVSEAIKISRLIRQRQPNIPIVWGGVHPTLFPEQTASEPMVDYAVRGEGELIFLELVEALQNNRDRQQIRGLTYRNNGEMINTPGIAFMEMDALPSLNWDLLDTGILKRITIVPAHTSRGCSHRCTFCINSVTSNLWRARSPEKVLDDLELIQAKFGDTPVRFWDENFFGKKERALRIIDGIYERGIKIQWETTVRANYFHPNFLNDEVLHKLKGSGCYKLCFGAESGSQRVLDMLWKDITVEQLLLSNTQCRKFGIIPEYSFMVGLPTETMEDVKMTIDLFQRLYEANKNAVFLGPQAFRPYPGAQLYEQCLKYGWKAPTSLGEWEVLTTRDRSFLSPKNFPWISDPDFVEALGPYLNYALKDIKTLLSHGVKANMVFKLLFILAAKLRWKWKYFRHPIEYKVAKYLIK